jgi:hypothetical protein
MPQVDELTGLTSTQLAAALGAGIDDISYQQTVTFTLYRKVVLPLDGFVFWVNSQVTQDVKGSLHWMNERNQEEDVTETRNSVVFTTQEHVVFLNQTNSDVLVVGGIEGRQYSFRSNGWYFPPANVWHYAGEAVNPSLSTQLIDDASQLDPTKRIVSNSLPVWLDLVNYNPVWLDPLNPGITLYPSYAVPDNLAPPFGAVHIEPAETRALQAAPWFDIFTSSHFQLSSERVRVTLYGCDNDTAQDWVDLVAQYSLDYDVLGVMNMPIVRDEKRIWDDGMVLAQKKTVEFDVSYVQTRINDIAAQMILRAQANVIDMDSYPWRFPVAGVGRLIARPVVLRSVLPKTGNILPAQGLIRVSGAVVRAADAAAVAGLGRLRAAGTMYPQEVAQTGAAGALRATGTVRARAVAQALGQGMLRAVVAVLPPGMTRIAGQTSLTANAVPRYVAAERSAGMGTVAASPAALERAVSRAAGVGQLTVFDSPLRVVTARLSGVSGVQATAVVQVAARAVLASASTARVVGPFLIISYASAGIGGTGSLRADTIPKIAPRVRIDGAGSLYGYATPIAFTGPKQVFTAARLNGTGSLRY